MTDSKNLKLVIVNALGTPEDQDPAARERGERARALRIGLLQAGFNNLAVLPPSAHLGEQLAQLQPDVIVVDAHSEAQLKEVVDATANARRPIVCFTEDSDRQRMSAAMEAGVAAYVVQGMSAEAVMNVLDVAIARFEVDQRLRSELDEARTKLAERKIIERAKGLLMERHKCSEDEAYRKLRRLAMDKNLKLAEVSQRMLDVVDLLL